MSDRPILLDTFCKAGGASVGYYRAGFDVVGVDIAPQKHYPFPFILGDALDILARMLKGEKFLASDGRWYGIDDFDAIHASPPCQLYSTMTRGRWKDREHPDLIDAVRRLLIETGKPYVIENVEGARDKLLNPILLCGTMFGLRTQSGSQLRRHRYFESRDFFLFTPTCQHERGASVIGVYGGGQHPQRRKPATIGVYGHAGESSKRDYLDFSIFTTDDRRDAMGIDWMTGDELSEAIPPAYTEFIGKHLLAALCR